MLIPALMIMALSMTACQVEESALPTETIFLPPTLVDTPSPPPVPTATAPRITVTPSCTDNLTFLEDVTIPDGTVVEAGATLDKRWLIMNSGTCNWDQDYQLVHVSGSELGVSASQALFPARSDTEAEISIVFTAPDEPGTILSAWQAVNPEGDFFGDTIFIEVVVE
ncbi:MAG: NBR1-Ig-like domain-containing protein [Anaerolineales bacterium]|nr:NBR1-Ig-like domain-containing protein [Anaerolineales bacterium]